MPKTNPKKLNGNLKRIEYYGLYDQTQLLNLLELYLSISFQERIGKTGNINWFFDIDIQTIKKNIQDELLQCCGSTDYRDRLVESIERQLQHNDKAGGGTVLADDSYDFISSDTLNLFDNINKQILEKYKRFHDLKNAEYSKRTFIVTIFKKSSEDLDLLMNELHLKSKDSVIKYLVEYRIKNSRINNKNIHNMGAGGPFGQSKNGISHRRVNILNTINADIVKDVDLSEEEFKFITCIANQDYNELNNLGAVTKTRVKASTMLELFCLRDLTNIMPLLKTYELNESLSQLKTNNDRLQTVTTSLKNDQAIINYLIVFYTVSQLLKKEKETNT